MFGVDMDPAFGVLNKSKHKPKSTIGHLRDGYLNLDNVGLGPAKIFENLNANFCSCGKVLNKFFYVHGK